MARKSPSRKLLRSLCAEVHPDDGIDPRDRDRGGPRHQLKRKAHQLCGQVAQALGLALAQSADEALQGLHIVSVDLAPDTRRLLVTVAFPPSEGWQPATILDRLDRASGRLRWEVASAITRKKAPLLVFRCAVPIAGERP